MDVWSTQAGEWLPLMGINGMLWREALNLMLDKATLMLADGNLMDEDALHFVAFLIKSDQIRSISIKSDHFFIRYSTSSYVCFVAGRESQCFRSGKELPPKRWTG
ncbi:hypothetical protein [Sphingobacterium griseoflavum]|uniref:Uncharacterized protein n=1 Tax=Sphingobacterium griseoflavum TaxID=1474952 RepID=A0ABQ3I4Q0_9SPHI|nr:hypothetical protein [Sphingobacterium griseoflavum]GHE49686.1 hypothetical protein GCM10017764_35910 [Sphingobacterium griseoflavum]